MKDQTHTETIDGWLIKTGGFAKDMALRDYLAAKALPWFLNKLDEEDIVDDHDLLRQFAAEHAYKMADAMLKARAA